MLIDATSGAGGLPVQIDQADAYYFAPQKSFAADGGLWIALLSPAAQERIAALDASERWIPAFLSLHDGARELARKTRPTTRPRWPACFCSPMRSAGCSTAVAWTGACRARRASSEHLYGWAERSGYTTPFVADPAKRSLVVGTIDFSDEVDAAVVAKTLRANGIVDTEPYRKLGRNQLRIGMFPAVEPADVQALTACIDWVVERISA